MTDKPETETKGTNEEAKKKVEKPGVEREYVIPLRKSLNKVPRYKRANKAVKTIKEFLAKHMKVTDRDIKKVRLDTYLNEAVWTKGIRNPPPKIKVKVIKEKDTGIVRAELLDLPESLKFKKLKIERRQKAAEETKKAAVKKEKQDVEKTDVEKSEEKEEKKEAEEKKAAVVESGEAMEKAAAKKTKHQTKISKQPKHQFRKALSK